MREHGCPVIWVRQEFEPDLSDAFLEMKINGRPVTIKGTLGNDNIVITVRRPVA